MEALYNYATRMSRLDYVFLLTSAKWILWNMLLFLVLFLLMCLVLGGLREYYLKLPAAGSTDGKEFSGIGANASAENNGMSGSGGSKTRNIFAKLHKMKKDGNVASLFNSSKGDFADFFLQGRKAVNQDSSLLSNDGKLASLNRGNSGHLSQKSDNISSPGRMNLTSDRLDLGLAANERRALTPNVSGLATLPTGGSSSIKRSPLSRQSSVMSGLPLSGVKNKPRRGNLLSMKSRGNKKLAHVAHDKFDKFKKGIMPGEGKEDEVSSDDDTSGGDANRSRNSQADVSTDGEAHAASVSLVGGTRYNDVGEQLIEDESNHMRLSRAITFLLSRQFLGHAANVVALFLFLFVCLCGLLSIGCLPDHALLQNPSLSESFESKQGSVTIDQVDVSIGVEIQSILSPTRLALAQCASVARDGATVTKNQNDWAAISHGALILLNRPHRAALCHKALSVDSLSQGARTMKAFSCVLLYFFSSTRLYASLPSLPLDSTILGEPFLGFLAVVASFVAHAATAAIGLSAECMYIALKALGPFAEYLWALTETVVYAASRALATGCDEIICDVERNGQAEPVVERETSLSSLSLAGQNPLVLKIAACLVLVLLVWVLASGRCARRTKERRTTDSMDTGFPENKNELSHLVLPSSPTNMSNLLSASSSSSVETLDADENDVGDVQSEVSWSNLSGSVSMDLFVASYSVGSPMSVATAPAVPMRGSMRSMRRFRSSDISVATPRFVLSDQSMNLAPPLGISPMASSVFGGDKLNQSSMSSANSSGLFFVKRREAEQQRLLRHKERCETVLEKVAKSLKVKADAECIDTTRRSMESLHAVLRIKRSNALVDQSS